MSVDEITIDLNGVTTATTCPTIATLLRAEGIDPDRRGIAVALNGAVVRRSEWERRAIGNGDSVEIITALQGG